MSCPDIGVAFKTIRLNHTGVENAQEKLTDSIMDLQQIAEF